MKTKYSPKMTKVLSLPKPPGVNPKNTVDEKRNPVTAVRRGNTKRK